MSFNEPMKVNLVIQNILSRPITFPLEEEEAINYIINKSSAVIRFRIGNKNNIWKYLTFHYSFHSLCWIKNVHIILRVYSDSSCL